MIIAMTNFIEPSEKYKSILLIVIFFMADVASANIKGKFDGIGMFCLAENAIAIPAVKAHGW